MNRRIRLSMVLLAVLATFPATAQTEVPPEVAHAAEQVIAYMEAIAEAGAAAQGDCDVMGRTLQVLADARGVEVRAAFAVLDALPALIEEELETHYKPRMEAVEADLSTIFPCATHPGVEAAMNAFFDAGPELPPVEPPATEPVRTEKVELTDALKAKAEQLVGFMEELGAVIDASRGDCEAMGQGLETLVAHKGAAMKQASQELDALDDAVDEALRELFDARMSKAEAKLEGLGACFDHPRVQAAMQSLF